jgi:hypothetical protein
MRRKRTIEITVETERVVEIRFRAAARQAAGDTDDVDDGESIRVDPSDPCHLWPAREPAPDAADD